MTTSQSREYLQSQAIRALNSGAMLKLEQLSQQLLVLDDGDAEAWFFLSLVSASKGRFSHAISCVDKALLYNDNDSAQTSVEYLSQKARYHSTVNEYQAAVLAADKAADILRASEGEMGIDIGRADGQARSSPKKTLPLKGLALLHDTLGVVFTRVAQFEKACKELKKAVALKPESAQFQFNLASALQFLGDAETAKYHYLKAIELKPDFYRAYWSLSELEKEKAPSSRLAQLERALSSPKLKSEDRLYLAHSLAREQEKRGDYARAFATLTQGKSMRRKQLKYRFADDLAIFDALKSAFSRHSIQPAASELGKECVFVIGMPRSGTTLVERIVSTHSKVCSLGELQNFALAVRRATKSDARRVLDPEIIDTSVTSSMSEIGEAYLQSLGDRRPKTGRFVDKLPLNFLYVGHILHALPSAKIVCLRRNPLDTCLSNYRQLFAITFSYYNYHYDLEDTARYYAAFDQLMAYWRSRFPKRVYEISYEKLIDEPEAQAKSLLAYLDLPWEEQCLNFHENPSGVATASAMQVREKLYNRAVGRWLKYREELKPAMRIFDDLGMQY